MQGLRRGGDRYFDGSDAMLFWRVKPLDKIL
jgi:hypothetical protein